MRPSCITWQVVWKVGVAILLLYFVISLLWLQNQRVLPPSTDQQQPAERPPYAALKFEQVAQRPLRIRLMQARKRATPKDVTLVTQLTSDRVDSLIQMADRWQGPMSVALYIRSNADWDHFQQSYMDNEVLQEWVDVHVWVASSSEASYPVNHLRNIGLTGSVSDYVLVLDVDFIPNVGMREQLLAVTSELDRDPKLAFVIAALETTDNAYPATKAELIELVRDGRARQVHLNKGKRAHQPTMYEQWYALPADSESYAVEYDYLWEPYVLLKKNKAPLYDQRFIGYGNDKASYTYELVAAGFHFRVLGAPFIIHRDHGEPSWRKDQGSELAWRRWAEFVRDVHERYGYQAPVPKWLKDDCKRGDCPRFWEWF